MTITEHMRLRRLRSTDGPLLVSAVKKHRWLIIGRTRWGARCACGEVVAHKDWRAHRCRRNDG